jgi:hypothetical protein
MNVEKFKQVVRGIVREELQKNIRTQIKEVMAEMLVEMAVNKQPLNNSNKAKTLREASFLDESELEEYPTMKARPGMDKARMAELLGYGDLAGGSQRGGQITIDSLVTESGVEVPIPQNQIPDELIQAFNRDYRPLMKALEQKKTNGS